MVMAILLLVCAVAQLVSSAPSKIEPGRLNLNHIIEEVNKCNKSFVQEFFVEDLQQLVDAGCKDDFFCKVQSILHKHEKLEGPKKIEGTLVRHLNQYIHTKSIDCPEVLKPVKDSTVTRPITVLLENLLTCSKKRNFGSK